MLKHLKTKLKTIRDRQETMVSVLFLNSQMPIVFYLKTQVLFLTL